MIPPLIGILSGRKATDAFLCRSLEQAGFRLKIIQYKIPVSDWIPWVGRRMRERGVRTFMGHILLSFWLRGERMRERIQRTSLWGNDLSQIPNWKKVQAQQSICFKEKELVSAFKEVDAVLLLDAFRLSHTFFRTIKKSCLQVVWGSAPGYLGDSGGYWAYTQGDPVCVSLMLRQTQFNAIRPIQTIPVGVTHKETLRTIKIKQAQALGSVLPIVLREMLKHPPTFVHCKEVIYRYFYAPTLRTYLKKNEYPGPLPSYAARHQTGVLYQIAEPL